MIPIDDLINVEHAAWPALAEELSVAPVPVEVLPVDPAQGRACLYRIQVTARSRLGALALNTGGLLVDHGWLRVLGAGHSSHGLAGLDEANGLDGNPQEPPPSFVVGHDAIGGRFEVNGADPASMNRPGEPGEICYLGPQFLGWEPVDAGHGDWLSWISEGFTTEFYEDVRWPGWKDEIGTLPATKGIAVFPFLWSEEAKRDLAATTRKIVDLADLFQLHEQVARGIGAAGQQDERPTE